MNPTWPRPGVVITAEIDKAIEREPIFGGMEGREFGHRGSGLYGQNDILWLVDAEIERLGVCVVVVVVVVEVDKVLVSGRDREV